MVEKAVTINTQKLEAQHSERIDSALRQAASDAAADKELALSEQRAQLKEEAEANAAAAVQDAEIKLREIANQELARQEQELKDEMAQAADAETSAAVTEAASAEREIARTEFAERLYAYHIHVLRPQTNPQLCPQQGTRGEARGRAEDPAQTERAGCHRAEGSGERHDG